jgi:hypothetical protein
VHTPYFSETDIRREVGCFGSTERQIRHSRIWIEQEVRQPAGIEIRPAGNRRERRRFGRRLPLILDNQVAAYAPPTRERSTMCRVGS